MVATLPLAAGIRTANARTASMRASTSSVVSPRTRPTTSSRLATDSVPPPFGPRPESMSGATAMKPSSASWSANARIQSLRPKISWMTITTGALVFRSG